MAENTNKVYVEDPKEDITPAIMDILTSFPPLEGGDVTFAQLPDSSGKAMYPTAGSYLQSEVEDVTGHVTQLCNYPFSFIYRISGASESRKIKVKEWLDWLGCYVQMEPIKYGNDTYKLDAYPDVAGKTIRRMRPTAPAYLDSLDADQIETWVIPINLEYQKEFDR